MEVTKESLEGFVYKPNRRYCGEKLFNRLLIATICPSVQHSKWSEKIINTSNRGSKTLIQKKGAKRPLFYN